MSRVISRFLASKMMAPFALIKEHWKASFGES